MTAPSSTPAPARRSRRASLAACGLWLAFILGLPACTKADKEEFAAATRARVLVENHTDLRWQVAFDPLPGAKKSPAKPTRPWLIIAPRESREVSLEAGLYRVRRGLLTTAGDTARNSETASGTEIELLAGHTYTWPLATLFSVEADQP